MQQISTGVAISSNCMKIQFLFQRHNFNFTDLRNPRTKGCDVFLVTFKKNRIREQLEDMRTPVIWSQGEPLVTVFLIGWFEFFSFT